jgi:hypothetical protein
MGTIFNEETIIDLLQHLLLQTNRLNGMKVIFIKDIIEKKELFLVLIYMIIGKMMNDIPIFGEGKMIRKMLGD